MPESLQSPGAIHSVPYKMIQDAVLDCRDKQYISKAKLYKMIDFIRNSLGITSYPLDPFEIQKACGESLYLELHCFGSTKIGGLLVKNPWPETSCIVLNSSKPPASIRFDCAHELIHFFLHPSGRKYICETLKNHSHPFEYQANEGAAELLLPYRQFIPHFLDFCSGSRARRGLTLLAEAYGVSLSVVQYRISSLSFEIDQYISGTPLHGLCILSHSKQIQAGLKSKELQMILDEVSHIDYNGKSPAIAPHRQNLQFDCVEYEKELIQCGFYEPYYRGY